MTQIATESQSQIKTEWDPRLDEGDHDRFSHYVQKAQLTEALITGTPCVALCGKVWTPSRSPEKYPVCPECKEIWESMDPGEDNDNGH